LGAGRQAVPVKRYEKVEGYREEVLRAENIPMLSGRENRAEHLFRTDGKERSSKKN